MIEALRQDVLWGQAHFSFFGKRLVPVAVVVRAVRQNRISKSHSQMIRRKEKLMPWLIRS